MLQVITRGRSAMFLNADFNQCLVVGSQGGNLRGVADNPRFIAGINDGQGGMAAFVNALIFGSGFLTIVLVRPYLIRMC